MKKILFPLVLALSCLVSLSAQAGVLVVTSANSALSSLTSDQVQQLFTGKLHEVAGFRLTPLDLPENSAARGEFYKALTGRNLQQMRAYWTQLIFTGRGAPPRVVTESDLRMRLQANPQLVGYLPAGSNVDRLTVLTRLP